MAEKKGTKKATVKVEKQSALSTILLVAIGAFIGVIIGYALFRSKLGV